MNQETMYQAQGQAPQPVPPRKKSGLPRFLPLVLLAALAVWAGSRFLALRPPQIVPAGIDAWRGVWTVEGTDWGVIFTGDSDYSIKSLPFRTDGEPFRDQIGEHVVLYREGGREEPHLFVSDLSGRSQTIYVTRVEDDTIVTLSGGNIFTDTQAYEDDERQELVFRKLYDLPGEDDPADLLRTPQLRRIQEDAAALLEQCMEASGYDFTLDPELPQPVEWYLPAQIVGNQDMNVGVNGEAYFNAILDYELCYGENGLRPVNLSFYAPGLDRVDLFVAGGAVR